MLVKHAYQIFSHTVEAGMTTLISSNNLPNTGFDTIEFIDFLLHSCVALTHHKIFYKPL